eukprot:1146578-Pelagomonas_calceolata.AAC.3
MEIGGSFIDNFVAARGCHQTACCVDAPKHMAIMRIKQTCRQRYNQNKLAACVACLSTGQLRFCEYKQPQNNAIEEVPLRKVILQWAKELQLSGASKIGYPGPLTYAHAVPTVRQGRSVILVAGVAYQHVCLRCML